MTEREAELEAVLLKVRIGLRDLMHWNSGALKFEGPADKEIKMIEEVLGIENE